MKFIVDAQLPPGLCRWLDERGHAATHVQTLGLAAAPDRDIADRAEIDRAVLITKDEDFLLLRLPDRFGVLWLRCGNTTKPALEAWLAERWYEVERLLAAGERLIELR